MKLTTYTIILIFLYYLKKKKKKKKKKKRLILFLKSLYHKFFLFVTYKVNKEEWNTETTEER